MLKENDILKFEKHIRNAWIAGCISAVITLIFSIAGTLNSDIRLTYGLDIWTFFDVVVILGLSYGIYKKNRFCALSMLIYFILAKFSMALSTYDLKSGLVSFVFLYLYFQGSIAAFKLHKNKIAENSSLEKKKRGVLFYILMSFIGLFIVLLSIFFTYICLSPEIEVIPGKMLNKKYINYLKESKLISPKETIFYWYSDALGSFKNSFYFFTDKKLVLHNIDWENTTITIQYSSITNITFQDNNSYSDDSIITITLNDDSTFYFPVSNEYDGDSKFFNKLFSVWQENLNIK